MVTVNLTSTPILSANPSRVAVALSSPEANRVTYCFGTVAVDRVGLVAYSTNDLIILTERDVPGGVAQELHAIAAVAPQDVGVVEWIIEP